MERETSAEQPSEREETSQTRRVLRRAADLAAEHLEHSERRRVHPAVEPGAVAALLPESPPTEGEDWDAIFDDYQRVVEANVTHWNHPGFLAYFATTGSLPGVAAETLTAALNVNAMLWSTSPAATELEERACDWLRQMIGLPPEFHGHINDTASASTLLALAAARQRALPEVREQGLADAQRLAVYCSDQAHSSVDKAVITLGLGHQALRRLPSDDAYRLEPAALRKAIERDLAAGRRPMAVVATAGTTSSTSVDPIRSVAEICAQHEVWLHVDAAYAGCAAICPELRPLFQGIGSADSVVLNPHKWLFVPLDCSVLLVRDLEALRRTFRLVPDYLVSDETEVTNLMDLGISLGRRFRALKLWMVVRHFGVEGLRAAIRRHLGLARELAQWLDEEEGFEIVAPVPFSVVCVRALPLAGDPPEGPPPDDEVDRFNLELVARINRLGDVALSHTRLRCGVVARVAIGNLRTERRHVRRAFEQLRDEAAGLRADWGWT